MQLKQCIIAACAVLVFGAVESQSAVAQEAGESGFLYEGVAVGSEDWDEQRIAIECRGRVAVYNTVQPRYDLYLPDQAAATGAAVLLLPGGGLQVLSMGEGTNSEVSAFLDQGVAVMVLQYRTRIISEDRVNQQCRAPDPDAPPIQFPSLEIVNGNANPAPDDEVLSSVFALATADAQAALALMHERAEEWRIDTNRIGVIGTSAGGGVAFGALLGDGPEETKPDFLISIFGPSLQDVLVPDNAPPLFLVTEADHGPVTEGLLAIFSIWKQAGEKVELHIYEVPNFSMTVDLWGPRLFAWMAERGLQPRDGAPSD